MDVGKGKREFSTEKHEIRKYMKKTARLSFPSGSPSSAYFMYFLLKELGDTESFNCNQTFRN